MAAVDIRGAGDLLSAYEGRAIETWAVFNKKNLMHSGSDKETLEGFIELLEKSCGTSIYTLKLYRDKEPDEITDKTESHGAYGFQLNDGRNGYNMAGMGGGREFQRIAQLEKELALLKAEGEQKEPTFGSTVAGWFQEPDDVVKILGAFGSFIRMATGKGTGEQAMQAVAALGNINPRRAGTGELPVQAVIESDELPEGVTKEDYERATRLDAVATRLQKVDADYLTHLEQLAVMAETKPAMYNMALSFLK